MKPTGKQLRYKINFAINFVPLRKIKRLSQNVGAAQPDRLAATTSNGLALLMV